MPNFEPTPTEPTPNTARVSYEEAARSTEPEPEVLTRQHSDETPCESG